MCIRDRVKTCSMHIKAVCYAGLFFWGCKQRFFYFQVSFCLVKRGKRAGSARNESDYSRRGTQISFPLLESRSCENFGLSQISISSLEKRNQAEPPFCSAATFPTRQLKNKLVRNTRNCDPPETENWSGYLSESSQTHSEKIRLDFLSLRGNNYFGVTWKQKCSVCNLKN